MAAAMAVPPPAVQTNPTTTAAASSLIGATPPSTPLTANFEVAGGGGFAKSSLYVGDLETTVDENKLYDLFSQVAPVISVRVCRDLNRRFSLGYGYVNFSTPQDACHARDSLNFTPVDGKPIRIMFSQRDPLLRKNGYANVFIKNLDTSVDNKGLYDTFAAFGTVLSCKVALDNNGKSKGYGFVQFDKEEAAQNAIKRLNGMLINDKQVFVGAFVRQQERSAEKGSPKFTNVYVKNICESIGDEEFKEMFEKFGPITSAVVMKDATGRSRCFGFVNFENPDNAAVAVESLNGSTVNEKVLYVGKAEKKAEREAELKAKFEQERNSRFEKLKGANLYFKNLDDEINEEKLKEIFSEFGSITSCKLTVDQNGMSKGVGFVAFSSPEEASKALNATIGKLIGRKPLYVSVAQKKEERKSWLQSHFAQTQTPRMMSPLMGMPGIHPGVPRLAQQQLCFGEISSGILPPHAAGYGFQQQHLSGILSNFVMPMQLPQQGQRAQRSGSRRGVANSHQPHPQRNSNQGGLSRYYMVNGRNGSMVPQGGVMGPVMPLDAASADISPHGTRPISRSSLSSALASASPDNQRLMLGEHLYPLVERVERNLARKVTGMLLEMDQTEVLHLIESPDALKNKVAEVVDVLRLAS